MRELAHRFISLRRNHPSWLLLASPKGALILASLKTLTSTHPNGIHLEHAVEHLASVFSDYANDSEYDFGDDLTLAARRELRQWLKRGLIVERNGQVFATDALQRSLHFVDAIEDHAMTSTASRLATVQRAIEALDAQLSRSQPDREKQLKARIEALTKELASVQAGEFEVLDGPPAEEGIREVFQLAISLQADFRRVEDSYREADLKLRQRIVREKQNRGQIVDELLDGHDALIQTLEGQVFESFYTQLVKSSELEEMKSRLKSILDNANTDKALQRKEKVDLRLLVSRLVQESERVIQARARSERDVRSFLTSSLADEQLRVGSLLQDILHVALEVDWQSNKIRRAAGPLPSLSISIPNLPLLERILPKEIHHVDSSDLELTVAEVDPALLDEEFWQAYRAMDRAKLFESTISFLRSSDTPLTLGELAKALPPTHDLETLAYWLAMARQAGIHIDEQTDVIELFGDNWTRFRAPRVEIAYHLVANLDSGSLE